MTDAEQIEATEQATRPTEAAAAVGGAAMFEFSRFIHLGPGASTCEAVNEAEYRSECSDPTHFHAWVRLPNSFQRVDLLRKSGAAAAVAETACRTEGLDSYVVLESDLRDLKERDARDQIIDELMRAENSTRYLKAMQQLAEDERFEHIDANRERLNALEREGEHTKPEEEQSEEFKVLSAAVGAWLEELKRVTEEIARPQREELGALPIDELISRLRDLRIRRAGRTARDNTMAVWTWLIGTMRLSARGGVPTERYFKSIGSIETQEPGALWAAAPEVIEALTIAFDELATAHNTGVRGNPS